VMVPDVGSDAGDTPDGSDILSNSVRAEYIDFL